MSQRPALCHLGAPIKVVGRRVCGRAVVSCLDRAGKVTPALCSPWPHELRGVGWHLAEIKHLVSAAPLFGAAGGPVAQPSGREPATAWDPLRPLLSAHYSALAQEREDQHHAEFHAPD